MEVTGSSAIEVMSASTSVENDDDNVEAEDLLLLLLWRRRRFLGVRSGGGKFKGQLSW